MPEARPPSRPPWAEYAYFIPRLIRYPQAAIVRLFRGYFERAPGWVLLTTKGRKTGLPREVLLPCERFDDCILVISTYGRRSNWIRNLERHREVRVTLAGRTSVGRAEIVDDVSRRQAIVGAHPFFVPFPTYLLNLIHKTVLRPLVVPFLRWWVRRRPVVLIHIGSSAGTQEGAAETGNVFHIARISEWKGGIAGSVYRPPSLEAEGFVHCSASRQQVLDVANSFFLPPSERLLLLRIEISQLSASLRFEPPAPVAGQAPAPNQVELFPHVYGPIDLDAISGVGVLAVENGAFAWPTRFESLAEFTAA